MSRFWTTAELLARGRSAREIRRAVESKVLQEVRRGHWCTAGAPPEVVRAARVGGVATATTASRALGVWTPPDPVPRDDGGSAPGQPARLQVAVPNTTGRLHDPDDPRLPLGRRDDVLVHWVEPAALVGTGSRRTAPPLLMLQHAFLSVPPERALAMLDSAIQQRFLRPSEIPALKAGLPARLYDVIDSWDRAESGIETITRFFLRRLGLRVEVLVPIDGVGTVDLLVEGRLIVELDGREFHDPASAFESDRRRDLAASIGRYQCLRFTWYRVLFDWPSVEQAVLAALAL